MSETASDLRPANFIAGEWVPSRDGATFERHNPWRPSEIVGEFPSSGAADIEAATRAAQGALRDWSGLAAAERGAFLHRAADAVQERAEEIAQDMTREMGKPLTEARVEATRAAAILRFFAGEGWRPVGELYEQSAKRSLVYTRRRPLGVVGLITPWNFPVAIPTWKTAPALAYGNTVVLKLAPDSPLTGLHLAHAFQEAGLPAGVLNLVIGGAEAGEALVDDPRVRAISFTGSVPVGRGVGERAVSLGKRVQLELGGHNPLIVADDASLEAAVGAAFAGAFGAAGQKCTATRRIFVAEAIYDEFRDRFLERVAAAKVGDPSDEATEVGPLVNAPQFEKVLAGIARGREEGGSVSAGGERADPDAYLISPTVFEGVGDDAFLSREEVFGPVTTLYRVASIAEAIERANSVAYGLSAAIFTSDLATAQQFLEGVQAGILHINSQTAGADVHVPFGGSKDSGYGPHEQGRAAIEFYSEEVTIYQDV